MTVLGGTLALNGSPGNPSPLGNGTAVLSGSTLVISSQGGDVNYANTVVLAGNGAISGRITLPKMVRELLNLRAGDQLDYKRQPDGSYRIRKVKQRISRAK